MNPNNPSVTPSGTPSTGNPIASVADAPREIGKTLKDAAGECASGLKSEAVRAVQGRKDAAVKKIGNFSHSIEDTAQSLEAKDPNIAWFAHLAAERVQRVADYLREHDLASLRDDCNALARRHPAAFFGGLFVAGLVAGNMLKATARGPADSSRDAGKSYRAQAPGEADPSALREPALGPNANAI